MIGTAIPVILAADATIQAACAGRYYPGGGVAANATRPYVEIEATEEPNTDLSGVLCDWFATVTLRVVGDTKPSVNAILARMQPVFAAAKGAFGDVTVKLAECGPIDDATPGPVDLDKRQSFEGTATAQLVYV